VAGILTRPWQLGETVTGTSITRLALIDGLSVQLTSGFFVNDLPYGVQRFVAFVSLTGRPGRSAVAGQLWPEVPEDQAQRRLRTTLWRAEKALPGLVEASRSTVGLNACVQLDVRELTAWGRRVLDPAAPVDVCVRGNPAMYGELLPGWYDDWVLLERERLRDLRLHIWEALSDKLVRAGRFGEAVEAAHEAIRAAPLRDSASAALIRAYAAEGNVSEALLAYQRFEERIADELGLAPSVQLESLVRRLTGERAMRTASAERHEARR
jgi:DNA-binding SARP family transcriptional activator